LLGWSPVWGFQAAVEQTVKWYRAAAEDPAAVDVTRQQISAYCRRATELRQPWAVA
jgi:hypothetical protein